MGRLMRMANDEQIFTYHMSRRGMLTAVGAGVVAGPLLAGAATAAVPSTAAALGPTGIDALDPLGTRSGDPVRTPRINGLHLQFGADAAGEVVVSWHALQPVGQARVLLGGPDGRYARTVHAETTSYTDGKSGQVVYAQRNWSGSRGGLMVC
jgi:hypothetical protein